MAEDEDGDIEFELGMSWLPAQVLDEACGDTVYKDLYEKSSRRQRQHHQARIVGEPLFLQSNRSRVQDRARSSKNRVTGGPGMRAIFLETGNRSCGTGVFLPRRDGDYLDTSRKPACSPILLPFHVIEALNLNARTFGSQISSPRDTTYRRAYTKESNNATNNRGAISPDPSPTSVLLPKDWSY